MLKGKSSTVSDSEDIEPLVNYLGETKVNFESHILPSLAVVLKLSNIEAINTLCLKCNSSKGFSPLSPLLMVNETERAHKYKLPTPNMFKPWLKGNDWTLPTTPSVPNVISSPG